MENAEGNNNFREIGGKCTGIAKIGGNKNLELITKKVHQQFWRIKIDFFDFSEIGESETGGKCIIASGGWTPLEAQVVHNTVITDLYSASGSEKPLTLKPLTLKQ